MTSPLIAALIALEENPPSQGTTGLNGDTGPKGDTGDQGPNGVEGPVGPEGPQGPKGPKGDPGPKGPKGDKGDEGPQGKRGKIGPAGKDGATPMWVGGGSSSGSGSGGAPSGPAGGDLSGTYPNPSVVNDSHSHTSATAPGGIPQGGPLTEDLDAGGFRITGLLGVFLNSAGIISTAGNPDGGGGTPAPMGSIALVENGSLWLKTDVLDTDWEQLAIEGIPPLGLVLAMGNDGDGFGIVNIADPVDPQDAMTLAYGDDNYDLIGAAAAAQAASQPLDSDLTAIAALTTTAYGRAFLELANAAAGRTALGLGTAAVAASGDFQPIDSDLTAIAALTTTAFGRALLTLADPADATKFLNGTGAFSVPVGGAADTVSNILAVGLFG